MIAESQSTKQMVALMAGIVAMAAGAALNVTHLVQGGQPLLSPMIGAVLALALGAVAAAMVAGMAIGSHDSGVLPGAVDRGRRGICPGHGS